MSITDAIKLGISPSYFLLEKAVQKNIDEFGGAKKTSVQKLKEDALREEIKASVLQNQAKVEQELAIARRIDSAEEVEIEEYYDLSGSGGLGITGDEKGVTAGLNGEGRKVTRRVIKFKGCKPVEQNLIQE